MALKLAKEFNGINAEYWRICDYQGFCDSNNTIVSLALYANKEARDEDVNNKLEIVNVNIDGVDMNRDEMYAKIKESKKETVIITPEVEAKEAVLDEEGNVVEPAVEAIPAVTEERETNERVDAIDC